MDATLKSLPKLLKRAQKAQAEADKFDPYKELDLDRQASEKDIKKAYRKLALDLHPDKYQGTESEAEVRDRFARVNRAKEILLDEGNFLFLFFLVVVVFFRLHYRI